MGWLQEGVLPRPMGGEMTVARSQLVKFERALLATGTIELSREQVEPSLYRVILRNPSSEFWNAFDPPRRRTV